MHSNQTDGGDPDAAAEPESELAAKWATVHDAARRVGTLSDHHVIVVPHPDDEVLSVGGLIDRLTAVGGLVEVLAVTDGGSAYSGAYEHDALASVRRREQSAALEILGVSSEFVTWLKIRDGHCADHEDDLTAQIVERCTEETTIVAPWTHDVHTDHEAVGRAARSAAERVGCALWYSLFWAWHHLDASALTDENLVRVDLNPHTRDRKLAALRCHTSQLDPRGVPAILDASNLEPSTWAAEYFITEVHAPVDDD